MKAGVLLVFLAILVVKLPVPIRITLLTRNIVQIRVAITVAKNSVMKCYGIRVMKMIVILIFVRNATKMNMYYVRKTTSYILQVNSKRVASASNKNRFVKSVKLVMTSIFAMSVSATEPTTGV